MLTRLVEGWKAWLRGDKRVAPVGTRGRIYERKAGGPGFVARATLVATLVPTRVYRAAEDAWYKRNPDTGELTKE